MREQYVFLLLFSVAVKSLLVDFETIDNLLDGHILEVTKLLDRGNDLHNVQDKANSLQNQTQLIHSKDKFLRTYDDLERVEYSLRSARAKIKEAKNKNVSVSDMDLTSEGSIYWNHVTFERSYKEMEKRLKIFIYEEGEPPIFHNGHCTNIYAIEGLFLQNIETSPFRTRNPSEAHLFFLPFSVTEIAMVVYQNDHKWGPMRKVAKDYVNVISNKYTYWNRTMGADHFMVACHDWGPEISFAIPSLVNNSIRGLCNANMSERFNPLKDVSIPEIHLPTGTTKGLIGGPLPSKRTILVFFAGGNHGPVRPILFKHWENKDPYVQVHQYLPKNMSYYKLVRKSKYCICASGYEVASPRMVEGIYMGCVPVLIKDHYALPFGDVLDWEKFAVIIPVKEIPNLKKILLEIPEEKYLEMHKNGLKVRRHFEVNYPPKRYDVFHMILHSIWLRRLNVHLHSLQS
ncbi:probable glycosyltransferase At5g03795 [Impatiens glandulifera]|uniref:probable glycosyltransferase At5g03795 n=1 Tax=Impatiens glandulifera TaxID=253017 RepID=UPI001FB1695E|nr:probable glycosyltransferase At5g03795 [Impatiens glandulifera]